MFSVHIDTARTWRGGQNQVLLTVLGLRGLGHRALLVAHPRGELRRRASEGLDLVPLAPRSEMDLRVAWQLSRLLKRLRPALVHAHDPHAVAMAALAASLTPGTPPLPLLASRRVDFALKGNAFSRWKYRQVTCFACASDAIRTLLLAQGIAPDRAVTIHEGIDMEHVAAAPACDVRAELWLPTHAPVVGNIAALVPHKGQRYLVAAASQVVQQVPDARFVIAGEGELQGALQHQVRELGLERHVLLVGFRPDVLSWLKGFDLFVLSSVTEGLGTSMLDAMACRKAVVGTTAGGIPELVEHGRTGLLVPPRDVDALAAAIVRLLQDRTLRERMGEAGYARVSARFTAERMVGATLDLYRRLAGRSREAGSPRSSAVD